ncbi:T9SS type A sorting domain-containing protein [Aestuariivivens sediminicola]|uniref:T9SS type A sorting domain-containing protein n=1 Tax=Aestuariivivens sediminicola TaxID=2913560 RepID=UPI001F59DB07|nr:T9SS type A sorting domain-containing protein [Aestuariivivens sediminicola]
MIQNITLLLCAVLTLTVSAQTVNIEGDPYGGNPYASINDAVAASTNAADVILVTGIHTESVTIQKSITLRGTDPSTDIIQAAASPGSDGSGTRVLSLNEGAFTINIENLGIRHGNVTGNGGGIFVDKVTGSVSLSNLIVENNYASSNGGAIGLAGTIATISECTIQNNTSNLDGGAILAAPNNASGINSVIDIKQSLIDSNTGRNGGAIYINGNANFGNDYLIEVNIENSTVSNNSATSASGGNGGGAIWSASRPWTSNTAVGNITLGLVHATFYNNAHAALNKSGLQFGSAAQTNFSAYNSIVVAGDDVTVKALNFANTNTTDVINCILGGLNAAPALVDDVNKNNQKGKTATFAGLTGTLTDEGGSTLVLPISESSTADDYCTAATGITMPTIDQRGYTREGVQDAGAFEFGGTLSDENIASKDNTLKIFPNPAKTTVYIKSLNTITHAFIYDMTGKRVFHSQSVRNNSLDVSQLKAGLYTLQVEDINHNWSSNKLVISR